jgi:PPOX class probable F420-dependent enzyme
VDGLTRALETARYGRLTTYRRDGRPVATPVWFALDGARLYVWTDAASGKAKRIRANGRAAVAPCDARGRTNAPDITGTARVLAANEQAHGRTLIQTKYRRLKPFVDLWTSITINVLRRKRPVEVYLELTLTPAAVLTEGAPK